MDDILIPTHRRWKPRNDIWVFNKPFNDLKLEKHLVKTHMSRTKRGVDFLGYHFGLQETRLADTSANEFIQKALLLYEREPPLSRGKRLGVYVIREARW